MSKRYILPHLRENKEAIISSSSSSSTSTTTTSSLSSSTTTIATSSSIKVSRENIKEGEIVGVVTGTLHERVKKCSKELRVEEWKYINEKFIKFQMVESEDDVTKEERQVLNKCFKSTPVYPMTIIRLTTTYTTGGRAHVIWNRKCIELKVSLGLPVTVKEFFEAIKHEAKYEGSTESGFQLSHMLISTLKKRYEEEGSIPEDEMEMALKALDVLIRYTPDSQIAKEIFELMKQGKEYIPKPKGYTYNCILFNLLCDQVTDNEYIEKIKNEIKDAGFWNDVTSSIYSMKQNEDCSDSINDLDRLTTNSYLSISTINITPRTSAHSSKRITQRGISMDEIKTCIKHGSKGNSNGITLCCDNNILVVCRINKENMKTPYIITVYRYINLKKLKRYNKESPSYAFYNHIDCIVTTAHFHDFKDAIHSLKEFLALDLYLEGKDYFEKKKYLTEMITHLLYCSPTVEDMIQVIEICIQYGMKIDTRGYNAVG